MARVMTGWVILVDQARDFPNADTPHKVITTGDYLARPKLFAGQGRAKIVNLSRSYNYQSKGYYASLLAEARGHRVIPTVETMLDLRELKLYEQSLPELQEALTAAATKAHATEETTFDLLFCFGFAQDPVLRLSGGSYSTGTAARRSKSPSPGKRWKIDRLRASPAGQARTGRDGVLPHKPASAYPARLAQSARAPDRPLFAKLPSCTIRGTRCRLLPRRRCGISSGSPKSNRSRSSSSPAGSSRNWPNSTACSFARRPRSTISPIASLSAPGRKACRSSTTRSR